MMQMRVSQPVLSPPRASEEQGVSFCSLDAAEVNKHKIFSRELPHVWALHHPNEERKENTKAKKKEGRHILTLIDNAPPCTGRNAEQTPLPAIWKKGHCMQEPWRLTAWSFSSKPYLAVNREHHPEVDMALPSKLLWCQKASELEMQSMGQQPRVQQSSHSLHVEPRWSL